MINTVSFFAVLIIDHRVVEIINVPAGFPGGGMHENGGINTHDVLMQLGHALPPVIPDIFFQFTSPLAVIIHGLQAFVNFTAGENKSILFAMRNN